MDSEMKLLRLLFAICVGFCSLNATLLGASNTVLFETTLGNMSFELLPIVAPKTVNHFKDLVQKGFYDGTAFHRVLKGFVAYGCDPLSKDSAVESKWGTGGPGYVIDAELSDQAHEFGVISMSHDGNPNRAGSRFLVCLGTRPVLNRRYTVFGKLVSGAEVLKKIGNVPVKAIASGERSRPTKRVEVKSIRLVADGASAK
jgi:peptidyl-prolyl cis-trans isomerase B (cyclophilin B)